MNGKGGRDCTQWGIHVGHKGGKCPNQNSLLKEVQKLEEIVQKQDSHTPA